MNIGIAYSSKDRVPLTKRTLKPLLQPDKFDTWWFDGSQTPEGMAYHAKARDDVFHAYSLTGGSCRYIVTALTKLLAHQYDYIGLVENDVLLNDNWFEPTMSLFETGKKDGLVVGAVSARTYVDRILIQRDGYAVMHNLGAGMIIFSREAAKIVLRYYRTGMTTENRKVFSLLSGIDIGPYWAFKGLDHMLVADWSWDRMLAQHGFCSLALTPAKARQLEDIAAMGLIMAKKPVKELRNDKAFLRYATNLELVRNGTLDIGNTPGMRLHHSDTWIIFPHQLPGMVANYKGDWRFHWSLGYGCFAWKSGPEPASVSIPVMGPVDIIVSGGEEGGKVKVEDKGSGLGYEPSLQPEKTTGMLSIAVPGGCSYRDIKITPSQPGIVFYGIRTREPQPYFTETQFFSDLLPPL